MKSKMRVFGAAAVTALGLMSSVFGADIHYVADDGGGEYCGLGYGIRVNVSTPASETTVKYAESMIGPWTDALAYTNVFTEKSVYFAIEAEGYASVTNSRTVTITPKTLTADYVWLVFPPEDYVYDGTAKVPDVAYADGAPSIITEDDFDVTFENNVNAGTARAVFTGKGNYKGTAMEEFEILKATYDMSGVSWDYAGEFMFDNSEKRVSVLNLPEGVTVASYTQNAATLPGTYTAHATLAYDTTNYNEPTVEDLEWTIKLSEETKLREIFEDLPVEIGPVGDGAVTRLSFVTTGGDSRVKAGDGGAGNPGGNGAPAVEVASGTRDGVKIDVGALPRGVQHGGNGRRVVCRRIGTDGRPPLQMARYGWRDGLPSLYDYQGADRHFIHWLELRGAAAVHRLSAGDRAHEPAGGRDGDVYGQQGHGNGNLHGACHAELQH